MMALACVCRGSSLFIETVFENRYRHVGELRRMGARIQVEQRVAVVEGVEKLWGTNVEATDLRGGAALICAALAAQGTTVIERIEHIDRGYDAPELALSALGADINREDYEAE
jgi:UDP-N-acetylglucosamine 1-carboxyvinyltransferase